MSKIYNVNRHSKILNLDLSESLTRSTFESAAFDLRKIFKTGGSHLRDMECEKIKCKQIPVNTKID
jgi:hypothetical protein